MDPPQHPHLPALLSEAAARFASQVAFTTCMPNGMHGSLTFAGCALIFALFVIIRQFKL